MRRGAAASIVVAAGLVAVGWALALEPDYLLSRGFPLDGAWTHAVYGRALAQAGMLAYNPGIPAPGTTSPLWVLIVAAVHLLTSTVPALLLGIKGLGASLHVLASFLLVRALAENGRVGRPEFVGCMLVAVHPDLVSASLSGMEIPLATVMASALLLGVSGFGTVGYGVLSFLAPFARPELTLLCFVLPIVLFVRRDPRRLLTLSSAAGLGTAAAYALMGGRNLAVSGWPLPASFYTSVGAGKLGVIDGEVVGFRELLGRFPVVDSSILLLVAAIVAVGVAWGGPPPSTPLRQAASALLAGLLFCAVSFVLVAPLDPRAFFHQRYVLPVIPLMVAATPLLVATALERWLPERPGRLVQLALLGLVVLSVLVVAPGRYAALSNDARNIDDVQVGIGRHLASAEPGQVVWAIDAGAARYFGRAFVVDLLGRHNVEVLGPDGQRFLDRHAPRYIEAAPLWSSLDDASGERLTATRFRTSTAYTVTSYPAGRQRWLVLCHDPAVSGQVFVRDRTLSFRCARPDSRPGRE